MKKSIVLIGMRGSGKTTVSTLLGSLLRLPVVDSDKEIEINEKQSIQEIVAKHGWDYFRDLETQFLRNYSCSTPTILSTGGGMVVKKENHILLKKIGIVIYLYAGPEISFQRIGEDKNRPSVSGASNMLVDLQTLFNQRKDLYKKTADHEINTEYLSVSDVVNQIITIYGR